MLRTVILTSAFVLAAGALDAQVPTHQASVDLNTVLPPEVATRVVERIAQARARELPAQALEHRVLELAAKGATPAEIERKVDGYAKAMELAKDALARGRDDRPSDEEVAAGGDVIARGVSGQAVAELARTAPADRKMAVPLYVLGALMEHHDVQTAFDAVSAGLAARTSDADMQEWVDALPAVAVERAATGRDAGVANRPGFAGIPAGIPANPGADAKPATVPPTQTPPTQPPPAGPPPAI